MGTSEALTDIALIFSSAALLGWFAHRSRQPLIMAYLLTGALLVISGLFKVEDQVFFSSFAEIGVSLLLFLIGLKLSLGDLKIIGPEALKLGLSQVAVTFGLALVLDLILGYHLGEAIFLSLALTFSSTIVVVKLLNEKKELGSLHGKLTVGLLLVQDLVVLLVMASLAGLNPAVGAPIIKVATLLVEAALLFLFSTWLARKPVPWLFSQLAGSTELLFVAAIGWCFTASALTQALGFPPEIGAFLAGIGLANAPMGVEIAAKVQPLRDFFLGIFFILLGAEMGRAIFVVNWLSVVTLVPFVLLIKPAIIWFILIKMGYRQRTAFLSAVFLGQISEFSLILLRLGEQHQLVSRGTLGTVVLVGAVSIGVSATLTQVSERLYERFQHLLRFGRRPHKEDVLAPEGKLSDHLILIGCDRSGSTILPLLSRLEAPLMVVDFNPAVIDKLVKSKINVLYGDIGDDEILEKLDLVEAKMVISTVTDWHDNLHLLTKLRAKQENRPVVILTARNIEEATEFYKQGADYVIVPEVAGGEHLASLITHHGLGKESFSKLGRNHYRRITERK